MATDRSELYELIDALPDEQVPHVVADLRRRSIPKPAPGEAAFAWIGAGTAKNGITDLSTNPAHLAGFGLD